jgi:hypothetical protein
MFYSEAQHDDYIEVDPEAFVHPYIRITPPLLDGGVSSVSATADEHLLLVMHCSSAELLVISTKRILIYRIPETKSLLRRAGGSAVSVATSMAIDSIPIVSDVSTILGGIGVAKTIKERFWSKTEAGMPSKKDAKNTVWDLNDEQICFLVVCYRDRILLENSFGWKTMFEMSTKRVLKKRADISIGVDGINFKIGGKKASIGFANPNIDFVGIARTLVVQNSEAFETAGWQADIVDGKLLLKK